MGLSQTFLERGIIPCASSFSCFVNLLQSEEARRQIVLVVDSPVSGKAKTLPQPKHRLETRDGSPRRVEGLEAADLWHVPLYPEMVTFDALLEVLGDIVDGARMEKPVINRRFDR